MKKTTNVLVICLEKIPSVSVGVLKIFDYLIHSQNFCYDYKNSFNMCYKDFIKADIIVLARATTNHELRICEIAKKHNKLLIYFLDDDLLDVPKESNTFVYMANKKVRQNMIDIMLSCDILWTVNSNIIHNYKNFFNRTYRIDVPYEVNLLNKEMDKDNIKILFAGSFDHEHGISVLLKETIENLILKYSKKVKFIFIGVNPIFARDYKQVECYPYKHDYMEYVGLIKNLQPDIGLAPLLNGNFFESKYYNKYLEYTSLGIVGVYTKQAPFTFVIKNQYNGLLCKNITESWEEQISKLIDNPDLIKKMYLNAFDDVKNNFNFDVIAKKLLTSIPELLNYKCNSSKVINLYERITLGHNSFIARVINALFDFGFIGILKKLTAKARKLLRGANRV